MTEGANRLIIFLLQSGELSAQSPKLKVSFAFPAGSLLGLPQPIQRFIASALQHEQNRSLDGAWGGDFRCRPEQALPGLDGCFRLTGAVSQLG